MKQEIQRAVDETFTGIACALRVISRELMADDGGTWANSRESINWEIRDLIQTIEKE